MLTAKTVAWVLGLAVVAFCVSTIVLAVQKNQISSDLDDAREKLAMMEDELSKTTTVTITSPGEDSTVSPSSANTPPSQNTPPSEIPPSSPSVNTPSVSTSSISTPSVSTPSVTTLSQNTPPSTTSTTTEDPGNDEVSTSCSYAMKEKVREIKEKKIANNRNSFKLKISKMRSKEKKRKRNEGLVIIK